MSKILIIEDEDSIRQITSEILRGENFEVMEAEDGQVGVELALQKTPDLIICDVQLPEMDGYSILAQVRGNRSTQTVPFIFLTAKSTKTDVRLGMELGADDYLTKPFTIEELLGTVTTQLVKHAAVERSSQQKLDDLRNNITLSLPHQLNAQLTNILKPTKTLIENYDLIDRDEAIEMLRQIYLSGQTLSRFTNNFLLYAELKRIEQQPKKSRALLERTEECLARIILREVALQKAEQANRREDLLLELLEETEVQISQAKLKKIAEELIDNAFKFSISGTPVRIRSHTQDSNFHLFITNDGRGMTAEEIANMGAYMQFEPQDTKRQGCGLGLVIAKLLTELHGGEFNIESIPNKQTTVRVMLPAK
jgi:CheY-like chemotaxis protein